MAVARYLLKTLDGIDRPAIATVMPNQRDGFTTVLDLGANVDCTRRAPAAVRGAWAARWWPRSTASDEPSVGLLNIGEEAIKGSETIKHAGELLRAAAERRAPELLRQRRGQRHLQGHDRHRGLRRLRRQRAAQDQPKAWPRCSADFIRQEFTRNPFTKLAALVALPVLQALQARASTTGATTAPRCSACAGWCSRATARPTPSPSSRRWTRAYDAARNRPARPRARPHRETLQPCRSAEAMPTGATSEQAA